MKNNQSHYQNTLLFLIVITAVAIDVSIPILPIITDYFHVGRDQAPLIISSFLAGYGLSMIPMGLLSDRYGRLPIMYIGIVIYIIAGAAICMAPNFETVLWGRFFQGIGGGVGPVNARAIARDIRSGKDLAKLMSALTAALFFAPICAPIIGGLLYYLFNWQIALLVPPVLGVFLLFFLWFTAYETLPRKRGISSSISAQFSSSLKLFFSSTDSIWAMLIISISFPGYQIIVANASVIITDMYHIDKNMVGVIFSLSSILIVGASIYNKTKSQFISPRKLLRYGILLSLIASGGWTICYIFGDLPFCIVWFFFLIYFAATGIIFSNTSIIALAPHSQIAGFASSVFGAAMILGSSVFTALAAHFYDGTLISITFGIIVSSLVSSVIFFARILSQRN